VPRGSSAVLRHTSLGAKALAETGGVQGLFDATTGAPSFLCVEAYARLQAAKELVSRAIKERLCSGNALNSPSAVRDYLRMKLQALPHEVFVVLFLDAQNRVMQFEELFRGTLTQTSVYPREVVKRALHHNAGAVIFAHNHPSGVAEPSHADETLTQALKQALALVDVRVLDHFIVAGSGVLSFAERGLL
jgi:DNA repair protein RadC